MKTTNFALRLPDSLYAGLKEAVAADNVAMNQYLAIALAEKLSARATAAAFFATCAATGRLGRALEVLEKAGTDVPEEQAVRELPRPPRRRKAKTA